MGCRNICPFGQDKCAGAARSVKESVMKKRMRCTFAAFVEKISTQMRRKNM